MVKDVVLFTQRCEIQLNTERGFILSSIDLLYFTDHQISSEGRLLIAEVQGVTV